MTHYIKDFKLYSEGSAGKCTDIFHSTISINDAEGCINKILNKHKETCKYYINIYDHFWGVSFNVDASQFEIMSKSMFEIHLFKSTDDTSIFVISNEINDYEQWAEVKRDLLARISR